MSSTPVPPVGTSDQPAHLLGAGPRGRLMRRATYAAVAVAVLLIVIKTGAWLITNSVAVLSTLVDSALDLAASVLNLLAVRQALAPADENHRFGHGKAEPLAGLVQAAFVGGSAVFLFLQAGERLINPKPVSESLIGIVVMGISITLTLGLVLYQKMVIRRTGSVAISADSLHYQGDLLVNATVIAALVLGAELGVGWADAAFGLGIAAYILWNALQIVRDSLDLLMDRELPNEERQRIRDLALAHPEVIDIHDLRTRSTGPHRFIQFHMELDGGMTLFEAHEIAEQVMYDIEQTFPGSEVLIHEDPAGIDERRARFT